MIDPGLSIGGQGAQVVQMGGGKDRLLVDGQAFLSGQPERHGVNALDMSRSPSGVPGRLDQGKQLLPPHAHHSFRTESNQTKRPQASRPGVQPIVCREPYLPPNRPPRENFV